MAEGDVSKVNYGFVSEYGSFMEQKGENLKQAVIGYGISLGVLNTKIAHAFLTDEEFDVLDCIEYINKNCWSTDDKITRIITFEEINLDKLD